MDYDNPPSIEQLKADGERVREGRLKNYPAAETATLRDLFAAFALTAVIGLNLEDSTHESDAAYAYAAADAMLVERSKES